MLKLNIHKRNNVVLPAKRGLFFLGHKIYPYAPLAVDAGMLRKIACNLNQRNIASYQAMVLPRRYAKQLPWLLVH